MKMVEGKVGAIMSSILKNVNRISRSLKDAFESRIEEEMANILQIQMEKISIALNQRVRAVVKWK